VNCELMDMQLCRAPSDDFVAISQSVSVHPDRADTGRIYISQIELAATHFIPARCGTYICYTDPSWNHALHIRQAAHIGLAWILDTPPPVRGRHSNDPHVRAIGVGVRINSRIARWNSCDADVRFAENHLVFAVHRRSGQSTFLRSASDVPVLMTCLLWLGPPGYAGRKLVAYATKYPTHRPATHMANGIQMQKTLGMSINGPTPGIGE